MRKKLKKSVYWANVLRQVCNERTEKRTALESEAYAAYLEGMCLFESEKWEEAQNSYMKCHNIYSEIIKVSD